MEVTYKMANGDFAHLNASDGWSTPNTLQDVGVYVTDDNNNEWDGAKDHAFTTTASIGHGDHCDVSFAVAAAS